jgi:heat-inducible transcriptional repressor
MSDPAPARALTIAELDRRSREIFREIVEAYLESGEPVGSRTIARRGVNLSPASIRNTMQDLAEHGLLMAPHASAGRVPTNAGLRLFVDGLLEIGDITEDERAAIEASVAGKAQSVEDVLERASDALSGLAAGAGLVITPTRDAALRHVEFLALSPREALAVLVFSDGAVENRVIRTPDGVTPSALIEAGSFLSVKLKGRTLAEARDVVAAEIEAARHQLDAAAAALIRDGFAEWSGGGDDDRRALIVRGRSHLLSSFPAADELERIRLLFDDLERKRGLIMLLDEARASAAVKIFIGAENPLFSLSGSSVVAAPYKDRQQRIVGALGVIGPTRLNYARVIPLVDYTARVVGRLLDSPDS